MVYDFCNRLAGLVLFCALIFPNSTRSEKINYTVSVVRADSAAPAELQSKINFVQASDFSFSAFVSNNKIFISIEFNEKEERRSHRSWVWNPIEQFYKEDHGDRESVVSIILKKSGEPFADMWIWRSFISNPAEIAEDFQVFYQKNDDSAPSLVKRDAGRICWESRYFDEFAGERLPRFYHKKPSGSSADVSARGIWKNGRWHLKISRALDTGNPDDIVIAKEDTIIMSVSRGMPDFSPPNPDEISELSPPPDDKAPANFANIAVIELKITGEKR